MIQILYYLFQQAEGTTASEKAYDAGYELGHFLGEYGIYIGATLLILIVLIILYIKKHRQRSRNTDE